LFIGVTKFFRFHICWFQWNWMWTFILCLFIAMSPNCKKERSCDYFFSCSCRFKKRIAFSSPYLYFYFTI